MRKKKIFLQKLFAARQGRASRPQNSPYFCVFKFARTVKLESYSYATLAKPILRKTLPVLQSTVQVRIRVVLNLNHTDIDRSMEENELPNESLPSREP